MQLPNKNTPIDRCDRASQFTQGALRRYPAIFKADADVAAKLESLATSLENGTTALMSTQRDYRQAVLDLIAIRIELKLTDLYVDDVVRSVKRAAEEAGRAVAAMVFPNGLTPIVKPYGQSQVGALHALEARLAAASSWGEGGAQLARVVEARELYEGVLTRRQQAMLDAAAKRALRDAAKEDFLDTFAGVAAGVKGTFLRDRRRQDVFFDTLRTRRAPSEVEGEREAEGDDVDTEDDAD